MGLALPNPLFIAAPARYHDAMRCCRPSRYPGTLQLALLISALGCGRSPDPEPRVPEERVPGSPSPDLRTDSNSPTVPGVENDEPVTQTTDSEQPASGGGGCLTDADCVPASCCHPAACVARDMAPSCDDVMCTQECRQDTMDCGGRCHCEAGRCKATLGGDS